MRLLLAGEGLTDVPMVRWGGIHVMSTLLKEGVRVYELQNKILHAKTVTIDGIYSSIGSFNFDQYVFLK